MTVMRSGASHVLRSVETALDCGVPIAMALAVALAAEAPASALDALAFVEAITPDLQRLSARAPAMPTKLVELEPELRLEPEVARVRQDVGDHELRGRLVFGELLGKRSFFQVAALAIAGIELSPPDAELLEQLGINTQLADVRIWPLSVVRRVAARNTFSFGVLAGVAVALNPNMGAAPVGAFMKKLDELAQGVRGGSSVDEQLEEHLARRTIVSGVGRPVLGPDERNVHVFALARKFGRHEGPSFRLAESVDAFFRERKKQHVNAAGWQGAIMRDMGFSPTAATAFCLLYFFTQILAQAVAADERLHRS